MMLYRVRVLGMCENCDEYSSDTFKWFETKKEAEIFEQLVKASKHELPATGGMDGVSVPESPAGLVTWLNSYVIGPRESAS